MSSRQVRRAARGADEAASPQPSDDEDELVARPTRAHFAAGLLDDDGDVSGADESDDDTDDDDDDDAEDDDAANVAEARASAHPAASELPAGTKPRRRAQRAAAAEPAPLVDDEEDEDWATLRTALALRRDERPDDDGEAAPELASASWWDAAEWPLRALYLSPDHELASRFGRKAVSAAKAEIGAHAAAPGRGAAPRARGARKSVFAPALAGAAVRGGAHGGGAAAGLSLERDAGASPTARLACAPPLLWYRFCYSRNYAQLADLATAAALSGDSRGLQRLLRDAPAHVEALCALAAVCERSGHADLAGTYVERAMCSYEAAAPPLALSHGGLLDARCRLRWSVRENASFLRAAAKRAAHAARAGCPRTAAELCRFLIGLTFAPLAETPHAAPAQAEEGEEEEEERAGRGARRARGAAQGREGEGLGGLASLRGLLSAAEAEAEGLCDPASLLLRIDAHCLRAGCLPLLRALPALCGQTVSLSIWPNLAFSLALAHRAAADGAAARAQLRTALCLFPAALPLLLCGGGGATADGDESAARARADAAAPLLARWRACMRALAALDGSNPLARAAGAPAAAAAAAAERYCCELEGVPYRQLLLLYDSTVAQRAFRQDSSTHRWLCECARELCDQLDAAAAAAARAAQPEGAADDAGAEAAALAEGAGVLALARDCALFRAAEWSWPRAELQGVSVDELGLSPLAQLPVEQMAADDADEAAGAAVPAVQRPGRRLDLTRHPLVVFVQSLMPWN
jgi:hypothetical protein